MEDYKLDQLWQSVDENAAPHFDEIKKDLKKSYSKKTWIEITRIKNLFWWELLQFGAFSALILFVLFMKPGLFGIGSEETQKLDIVLFVLFIVIYISMCIWIYKKMVLRLREVATLNVMDALNSYLDILKKNRALLTKLSVLTLFVFYATHVTMEFFLNDFSWMQTIFSLIVITPFSYFCIHEYFEYLYKPSETEIEILINQFQNE